MSHPIRVLQAIETGGYGGAEMVLLQLATHLSRGRYAVIAGVGRDDWLAQNLRAAGVRVFILGRARGLDVRLVANLVRVIRRERVSLVHSHMFRIGLNSCLAARVAGIPAIVTVHGLSDFETGRRRLAIWFLSQLASRIVTVSRYLRRQLMGSCRVRASRIATIHNGVPLGHFPADHHESRRQVRAELDLEGAFAVGTVGRLSPVKGHQHLIDAIAGLADETPVVRLLIVGPGPLRSALAARSEALGLADRVRFLGFRDDIPRLLSALDCFVLPSLSEGLSIATMEAMAAGLPVVVTDSGGPSDLVEHGETGLVVPPGDASALSAAIATVLREPELARRLGAAARRRAQAFDMRDMVDRYEMLYREVLSDRKRA
ncbi:MAG: glycosyltransferase [Armatimonadota bacterium]|nr:MAG: glycosyltransferase [Armatimonadota bacterium]